MGAFGSMFPGQKLDKAREEDADGEGHRLPPGPLDLDAGVVELSPPPRSVPDDEPDADD